MQLSVVILNYNVKHWLQLCLQSVKRAVKDIEAEIIVVDNASSDDSLAMVAANFPEVKVVANSENLGFAKANNLGVSQAVGEYVCILNPDTVVPENIFQDFLAFAKSTPQLGALGPQFIDGQGEFLPESKRNLPTPKVALKKLLNIGDAYYATHVKDNEIGAVEILVGALLFISRKRYNAINGFDEAYYMYGEDIDFTYSLLREDLKNYYKGDLKVLHFKGESTTRDKVQAERFYGAMRIFYKKYFKGSFLKNLGVYVFTGFAKSINRKPKNMQIKTDDVVFVGSADFAEKLSEQWSKTIKTIDENMLLQSDLGHTNVIFDAGALSFSEIIEAISALKNRGNTFRIRPEDCNFMVGSDSPYNRGEVIYIEH